jgi:hypothetical protein
MAVNKIQHFLIGGQATGVTSVDLIGCILKTGLSVQYAGMYKRSDLWGSGGIFCLRIDTGRSWITPGAEFGFFTSVQEGRQYQ